MDGIHDLGGRQGFGPVRHRPDARAFHEPWELEANALQTMAIGGGVFNMDEHRHAIERMEPRHYLDAGYYERSLTGVASLLVEKGLTTPDDLAARAGAHVPLSLPIRSGRANAPDRRAFQIGDRVRVQNDFVAGHIRMPGYIRGRWGVVVGVSPPYPFPDAHAHMIEADPEPTYDVRFQAQDLWPDGCDAAAVHVGVFESYLTQA